MCLVISHIQHGSQLSHYFVSMCEHPFCSYCHKSNSRKESSCQKKRITQLRRKPESLTTEAISLQRGRSVLPSPTPLSPPLLRVGRTSPRYRLPRSVLRSILQTVVIPTMSLLPQQKPFQRERGRRRRTTTLIRLPPSRKTTRGPHRLPVRSRVVPQNISRELFTTGSWYRSTVNLFGLLFKI